MADLRPLVERWIREWWDREGQEKIRGLIRGGRLSGPSISGTIPVASLPASVVQTTDAATTVVTETSAGQASAVGVSTNYAREDHTHGTPSGGSGTVTSVGLTVPGEFSVSGSPVTGSGTLAVSKANQSANQVFAGPTSGGAAAPTFRALVANDVPTMVGDSGSGGTKGAVPAPSAGDAAAGKFLKSDATWAVPSGGGGGGSVASDTIWDAKGDLAAGTGADTAAKLSVGTDGYHLVADSSQSTGLRWAKPATFKHTILNGGGNKTTTSTSFTPIDSTNLGFLTLTLAVGDVVRCILQGQSYSNSTGANFFDFDVDQPTSANVRVGEGADSGVGSTQGGTRIGAAIIGHFVCTEAGSHGFRPVWRVSGNTATLANATSGNDDTVILFSVQNLGPVS